MIGLMMLAAHMAGDFLLQNKWMAENKLKDWAVRWVHCLVYLMCFVPVEAYYKFTHPDLPKNHMFGFGFLIYGTHFLIDSYVWASGKEWEHKPFIIDQTLHIIVLAVIGGIYF